MQQRKDCRFLLVKAVWIIIPYSANSAELLHKKRPRRKFNLNYNAVLLQTAGLTISSIISDTFNMAADRTPLMLSVCSPVLHTLY